jgi:hypothetical protein
MLNLSKIFTDIGEVTGIVQASVQSAQAVAAASGTEAKAETVANLAAAAVQEVAAAKGTTVDVSALPGKAGCARCWERSCCCRWPSGHSCCCRSLHSGTGPCGCYTCLGGH